MYIVTSNTYILSSQGYIDVERASSQASVLLWNGTSFSEHVVTHHSETNGLYRIVMENGMKVTCQAMTKWHTKRGVVEAQSLLPGDTVVQHAFPRLDVYGNQYMIHEVPLNHTTKHKIAWLQSLLTDTCCEVLQKNQTIVACIFSYDLLFIRTLQLLLTTLNIESFTEYYDMEPCCLSIDGANIARLVHLGVSTSNFSSVGAIQHKHKTERELAVHSVMPIGFESSVYTIEPLLPKRDSGPIVCNGIYV